MVIMAPQHEAPKYHMGMAYPSSCQGRCLATQSATHPPAASPPARPPARIAGAQLRTFLRRVRRPEVIDDVCALEHLRARVRVLDVRDLRSTRRVIICAFASLAGPRLAPRSRRIAGGAAQRRGAMPGIERVIERKAHLEQAVLVLELLSPRAAARLRKHAA